MPERRAFITGITGQDGSYLAELLLEKDYVIYGLIRRTSTNDFWRIRHLEEKLRLIPGDITDHGSLERAVKLAEPHEIYHFAAQSFVHQSFNAPIHTAQVTGLGTLYLLEATRLHAPTARFYQASSSEQFGNAEYSPQSESTSFNPISPYGAAKVFAHTCARIYRESYGRFIVCGIAYNHESPRRGEEFVTRKITKAIAQIKLGNQKVLYLGNTGAHRDWSHAKDVVRGAWLSLQVEQPGDYVFATGVTYSVKDFFEMAFNYASLDPYQYVQSDPDLLRPSDVHFLCGNSEKAYQKLGWKPTVTFGQLVQEMVEEDLLRANALNRDPVKVP